MTPRVHVMGAYWHDDSDLPTALGELVGAAKDRGDIGALDDLGVRLKAFVATIDLPTEAMVIAVPPGPDRRAHPVPALAEFVAEAVGVSPGRVLARRHATDQLRNVAPERRRAVVEAAGYEVVGDVAGAAVVLVDDVVLTGTTIDYLSEALLAAGAASVDAVVVCRTRRTG